MFELVMVLVYFTGRVENICSKIILIYQNNNAGKKNFNPYIYNLRKVLGSDCPEDGISPALGSGLIAVSIFVWLALIIDMYIFQSRFSLNSFFILTI